MVVHVGRRSSAEESQDRCAKSLDCSVSFPSCHPSDTLFEPMFCTATAIASRRIVAKHRLIATGTPVQNRVHELWAAFDFLMPNFLGTASSFAKEFAQPIVKGQLDGARASVVAEGLEKLNMLHQQVLPFILRRDKSDVLKELPPKIVSHVKVSMTETQNLLYRRLCSDSTVQTSLKKLDRALNPTEQAATNTTVDSIALKSLLLLRLVCTHPSLLAASSDGTAGARGVAMSGKLLALIDLMRNSGFGDGGVTAADNDTSLLYCDDSQETEGFDNVVEATGDSGLGPENSKLAVGAEKKCIVFAQFTKSLDLVEDLILKSLMPTLRYVRLDGRVPSEKRADLAHRFNTDPSIRVFLATTRAGGLGLNFTGRSLVSLVPQSRSALLMLFVWFRSRHRLFSGERLQPFR